MFKQEYRTTASNSVKLIAGVIAALTMSACTVGPDYQSQFQVGPLPQDPAGSSSNLSPTIDVAQHISLREREAFWWRSFNQPELDTLVDLTLEHNPSLDAARANVKAAYAVFNDVDNDDWLNGNLAADYTRQRQAIPGVTEERVSVESYRLGAGLNLRLDLFGKLERAAEAAKADAESRYFAWQDLQVSLVAQVAETYASLKGLRGRMDVAERNIESLGKTRKIIKARIDAGFSSPLDLHRIDAELYGVKATLPRLKAEVEKTKNALIALAGGQQNVRSLALGEINAALPNLDTPLAIGDPKTMLRRRSDLRAAERKLASATAAIGFNKADYYPDISVSGFIGFLAGDSASFSSADRAWSIAPSLTWSVFDFGSIKARVAAANAQQEAAFADFQQHVVNAVAEAQSALSSYAETQHQRHLLEAQTRESTAALRLAQTQYNEGAVDLLNILDTERTLLAAEDNLVQAQTRTFQVIVDVYRAFGGGLRFNDEHPPANKTLAVDSPPISYAVTQLSP